MDKKLLEKYNLKDAQKRFQQICEYTFITTPTLVEDDDDDEGNDNTEEMPDGNEGGVANGNGNNSNMNDFNPMGNNNDDEDNNMADDMDGNMPSPGNNGEEMVDDDAVETTPMENNDEVIDVDDLTQSQEETEYKVDGVDDKLLKLLNVVNNFEEALEQNSQKIEALKSEFEKRNPTETEKLNLRSQDSYPYTEQPKDFFEKQIKKKANYDIRFDNSTPLSKEQDILNITANDLRGGNDREIYRSMGYDKLSDFLNY